ncbi:dihydroxyacetone kinase subunit DhaK [Mammaliicoccus stepanovicii]|uniref:Dihydroxyacetone kinase subunit DhaK n=1 Tax=Mammaliicoccus stepanovicii TaxID=643214 RepID=A0A239YLZ8_9STAP|nr:dihydroxyacetone kinase subunit DhaK [Mammaliicoccus stepanovicii]PNZ75565.1 dihydroxyacetone kinase subunit DhaK [Mammaliicoccus stepanovicii]GGI41117.1 dihydroxyacetone kinase subunit DhaK [Mammaliicoccus stepanovicii]SNV59760.1 dihydroxyacetone kinase subunit DhaK [Mammaliicoccus stepanovicii]
MKKLMNEKTQFVADMLKGIKIMDNSVDVISDNVIVRSKLKTKGVALVSGGGSGHEPAHAGFVADGMLDAAVCGEVFTSPTPDKILDAIKHVATEEGVLLIIKNYAGDVMNFEMAQEMAEMEGISCQSVIVRDDISIDNEQDRRGVAGTVLVHKYAGYLSDNGYNLADIKEKVEAFIEKVKTIGMAIYPCLVPTTGQYGFDLEDDQMEIGIGIHGERGIYQEKIEPIPGIIKRLMNELEKEISEKSLIVMINGMGATPDSELAIVANYFNEYVNEKGFDIKKYFVGNYMTALDMQGFSITLVPYDQEYLDAFNAPTVSKYFK